MEPPELDYLVFSSHKTATQTLTHTLRQAGFTALHCHSLAHGNVPISPGTLAQFAARRRPEADKLKIVSVFREPIERLASSMFQAHGKHASGFEDSIIHKHSVDELRDVFFGDYCGSRNAEESLVELAAELHIPLGAMTFDAGRMLGQLEGAGYTVILLRFDLFAAHAPRILRDITGRDLSITNANLSEGKWYEAKYAEFRQRLRLPRSLVEQVYSGRRELIEIFDEAGYDGALARAIERYC